VRASDRSLRDVWQRRIDTLANDNANAVRGFHFAAFFRPLHEVEHVMRLHVGNRLSANRGKDM
jgi:hypothetical protein